MTRTFIRPARAASGPAGLPVQTWLVLAGDLVSSLGSGMAYPYVFVYLHLVCGLSLGMAGAMMTVRALCALSAAALGGAVTDRVGAKTTAVLSLAAAGISAVLMAAARGPLLGVAAVIALTVTQVLLVPALQTLLAVTVPEDRREKVFAWRYTGMNLGTATGAVIASVALGVWQATHALRALCLADAASYLVFALVIGVLVTSHHPARRAHGQPAGPASSAGGGYRQVVRDPAMRCLLTVVSLVVAAGFAQFAVGLPALLTVSGHVAGLGWVVGANMAAVVLLQLPVQKRLAGRRRHRILIAACMFMAAAWALVLLTPGRSLLVLAGAAVVFAVGETLFAPVVPALVNDLAPSHLRGRYNGAQVTAHTAGFALGVAAAGALIAIGQVRAVFVLGIACFTLAAAAATRLAAHLTPAQTHVPHPEPALAVPADVAGAPEPQASP